MQVRHAEHQDGPLPLQVVREKDQRGTQCELDGGNPGPHGLDGEQNPSAQDLLEVGEVAGDVGARRVEEVELLEREG